MSAIIKNADRSSLALIVGICCLAIGYLAAPSIADNDRSTPPEPQVYRYRHELRQQHIFVYDQLTGDIYYSPIFSQKNSPPHHLIPFAQMKPSKPQ